MKTIHELRKTARLMIAHEGFDGGIAQALLASSKKERPAMVVFSWGGGWDHVSVSFPNRCQTWEEMCEVKHMFFRDDECVVQYHPIRDEYVNNHKFCLHLWRAQDVEFPTPPYWMVGTKDKQTRQDAMREGMAELMKSRDDTMGKGYMREA